MKKIRIGIIGAGPGGLTAAMILANRGLDVSVYEKQDRVGGRNARLQLGDFSFDTGPTFLMMKYILDEMFEEAGEKTVDYLKLIKLDPLYRLKLNNIEFVPSEDINKTKEQISKWYPGNEQGVDQFMRSEGVRFQRLYPCLQKDYGSLLSYLNPTLIKALPVMSLGKTVFQNLGRYFSHDDLKIFFAFQSKYLGMSPWNCPAFFTMLSYIEHSFGIYHVEGGLNQISRAMANIAERKSAKIHLNTPVRQVLIENRKARGVILESGEKITLDDVIINADFGYSMGKLVPEEKLRKYSPTKLDKWKLSCSTFMIYLGVKKIYNSIPHHNIIFAKDYKRNVEEITNLGKVSSNPSLYIQNACVTDSSLAPQGKSTIYILVPVPNLRAPVSWESIKKEYKDKVLDIVENQAGFTDIRKHIEEMKIITPENWEKDYCVYQGATFNLAHTLGQVLYLRPHNRFEELNHCYLVGGGTHPGSGLPTIYESARISSNLICRKHGVPFTKPPSFVRNL